MSLNRRRFLRAAGAGAAAALAARPGRAQGGSSIAAIPELVSGSVVIADTVALPPPQDSGIQHIVVVTMENRSFDHFFGWLRGADGRQAGLRYADTTGSTHATYPLAPDYKGCGHPDPEHSYNSSRVAWNNGAMDGFLRAGSNDVYSIGYYTEPDLPFLGALAQHYLICDRYFASILGPTFANRMFSWAAQTDRLTDSVSLTSLPTILDSLSAVGVSHRYYFNNLPFLALWGVQYLPVTSPLHDFLTDAASGSLPAVSFVDPIYTLLDDGTGNDDHPHADIRNGDAFLAAIFQALASGPAWPGTVLIVTFDEWGGFFEHVAPPRAAAPNNVDPDLVNGQALLGFRVPAIVASPFTRNRAAFSTASRESADAYAAPPAFNPRPPRRRSPAALVNHTVFDHTSALKLIEWRWGLPPLTARDGSSQIGNLAVAMNFSSPDGTVPPLPNPAPLGPQPCSSAGSALAVEGQPQAQQSPWTALARTPAVQAWLEHPRFRRSRWPENH